MDDTTSIHRDRGRTSRGLRRLGGLTGSRRSPGGPQPTGGLHRALVRSTGRFAFGAALAAAMLLGTGGLATAAPTASQPAAAAASAEASAKVDVNSASATELASLPGIGDSKAAAIIAEREKKPFDSVDDLERVRGIGVRTLEDLRSKVSVGKR